jgi:hypothetical protein
VKRYRTRKNTMGPATTCLDERYECRTINDVLRRDNLIKSKLTKMGKSTKKHLIFEMEESTNDKAQE